MDGDTYNYLGEYLHCFVNNQKLEIHSHMTFRFFFFGKKTAVGMKSIGSTDRKILA